MLSRRDRPSDIYRDRFEPAGALIRVRANAQAVSDDPVVGKERDGLRFYFLLGLAADHLQEAAHVVGVVVEIWIESGNPASGLREQLIRSGDGEGVMRRGVRQTSGFEDYVRLMTGVVRCDP